MYKILLILFLLFMIPNIVVYAIHAHHELEEANEHIPVAETNHKGQEQLAEGIFFTSITVGYTITTLAVIIKPNNFISYYAILIGTILIIIIYYLSKTTGFPAPDFYDNMILDDTTSIKDLITKVSQQIFVIPLSMLLMRVYERRKR